MPHHAVDERHELAATLRLAGPDAPTLCGSWTSGRLAAHLVLRERSLVEVAGRLPIRALRSRACSALDDYLQRVGFTVLVDQLEAGPPPWSPWSIPPLREAVNLLEYVVHHEDIRRATESWTARAMPIARQQAIWSRLRVGAPLTMRSVAVGVELNWPSHGTITARRPRPGTPSVRVSGDPVEIALLALGRQRVSKVSFDGTATDIAVLAGARIAV